MDRIRAGDLGRGDDVGDPQIGVPAGRRTDADVIVGKAHVERLAVGLAVDRHRLHIQFPAGANDPQGNFPAVGNENLLKHARLSSLPVPPFDSLDYRAC